MITREQVEKLPNPTMPPSPKVVGAHATEYGQGYEHCRADVLALVAEGEGEVEQATTVPGLYTLEYARANRICRVCGAAMDAKPGSFKLNYGEEFAHECCLEIDTIKEGSGNER